MRWILVCNSNVFDLKGAIKENNVIDWPQLENVAVGDIVYFYMSLPYDSIMFKCQVQSVNNHGMGETTTKYVKHPLFYDNRQTYMKLSLLEAYPEGLITGKDIIEKGFHNLQMSSRVSDDFSKYVDKNKKEIGEFNKKSIKWLIGIGTLLIAAILFFVISSKTEPVSKPDIMINQSLLKYSDMTHAEFVEETGIKATKFHTYMYTAQVPYKDVEVVFGATEYDDAIHYLKDSDKCFRLQGQIGVLLDGIEEKMTLEEFTNSLSWNGEKVEYALEEGGGTVYYVSSEYAAVLFDSDGNGETDALLNIDMYEKDTIGKDSYAWLFMGVEEFELNCYMTVIYDAKQTAKNVSDLTIAIKSDLRKYQNMTYSQYKELTGADVGRWRDNTFGGDIPNTNLMIAFRGSGYEWDDGPVYQLQEHDLCYRLEGTLGDLLENIVGEMTIEDLMDSLSKGTNETKIQYGQGYAGVQTLSESWAVITFDSNQDGQYDAELHIDTTEKNTVNSETLAWVVLDLRDNYTEVLGWDE